MTTNHSKASKLGTDDGTVHGIIGKMCGARAAFIKRPELIESDWRAYQVAYDAAVRHESTAQRARGAL